MTGLILASGKKSRNSDLAGTAHCGLHGRGAKGAADVAGSRYPTPTLEEQTGTPRQATPPHRLPREFSLLRC